MRDPGLKYARSYRLGAGRQHVSGVSPPSPRTCRGRRPARAAGGAPAPGPGSASPPAGTHAPLRRTLTPEGHAGISGPGSGTATQKQRGAGRDREKGEEATERWQGGEGEAAGGGQGWGPHLVDAHFRTQLHGGHVHRLHQRLLHRDLPAGTQEHRLSTGGRGLLGSAGPHTTEQQATRRTRHDKGGALLVRAIGVPCPGTSGRNSRG
jgi:hypothetical protein